MHMNSSLFTLHSSLLSEVWSTSKRNKLRTSLTGFACGTKKVKKVNESKAGSASTDNEEKR